MPPEEVSARHEYPNKRTSYRKPAACKRLKTLVSADGFGAVFKSRHLSQIQAGMPLTEWPPPGWRSAPRISRDERQESASVLMRRLKVS